MAVFKGNWYSQTLNMNTHLTVCMPDYPREIKATVILLHGLKGDSDVWMNRVGLEFFANKHSLAFIMPEVQRSWYIDMAYGLDYFTYVTDEVPQLASYYFNLPTDRDHLYVGGLSMGGYGAIRCALKCPDRYKGAMSFSARVFMEGRAFLHNDDHSVREFQGILGLDRKTSLDNATNVRLLLDAAKDAPVKPAFYVACGTEDTLYPESVEFTQLLRDANFDVTYEEWAGIHSWDFWRESLPRGLKALGLAD